MINNKIINLFDNDNNKGNTKNIVPIRIKQARILRGMTMEDLSKSIDITKQAISKIEMGTLNVSPGTLLKISEALNFPIHFFSKEIIMNQNSEDSITFFRTKKIPAKTASAWNELIEIINYDIIGYIKSYFNLPEANFPDISDISSDERYTNEDIERIAMRLRKYWELGSGPINNLAHVAQKNGIIVVRINLNDNKTDAFSKWKNKTPYILLNAYKNNLFRSRFDLAHEIGHLILHNGIDPNKFANDEIEDEANKFASAFLLPEDAFGDEVYTITLDSLLPLKKRWKVSVNAMTRRCLSLGFITQERYTSLQKQISARRWRTAEPLDDIYLPEKTQMLNECLEVLIENNILDKNTFLDDIALSKLDLCDIMGLPRNYFEDNIIKSDFLVNNKPKH